jgi:ATP-dependent DNA helicase RecG
VHPDHIAEDSAGLLGTLNEPVYPLCEGLTQGRVQGLVEQALGYLPKLPEWIEPGLLDKMGWPAWDAVPGL